MSFDFSYFFLLFICTIHYAYAQKQICSVDITTFLSNSVFYILCLPKAYSDNGRGTRAVRTQPEFK